MLSVIKLASKLSTIMRYAIALNASKKKEDDTNYRFKNFYACAAIKTLQSAEITLLAWYYFWREDVGSDTFLGKPRMLCWPRNQRLSIEALFVAELLRNCLNVQSFMIRDAEAGSGSFSAEARKFYHFHLGYLT